MLTLVDSHCHLQDKAFRDTACDVVARAREAGVAAMVCCGTAPTDWAAVDLLCRAHKRILPSFGVHPWYVGGLATGWQDELRRFLLLHPEASVGEIGLDHAIKDSDTALQESVFMEQIGIANELNRPISIHCRRAWGALEAVIRNAGGVRNGFMIHSYSGGRSLVPSLAGLGAYFSFSASLTYPNNRKGHDAAVVVPPDKLLVETDAPDMTPHDPGRQGEGWGHAERPNEPAALIRVVETLAGLRGTSPDEIARLTTANAGRLFGLSTG